MPQPTATRPAVVSRPPPPYRRNGYAGARTHAPPPGQALRRPGSTGPKPAGKPAGPGPRAGDKPEHEILFQQYFKSANPQRTYAAQLKKANNGNHYLVLTEGKRDPATGEVRKTRVFLYGEDFIPFFKLLQSAALFIKANPVPEEIKKKRERIWAKQAREEKEAGVKASPNSAPSAPRAALGSNQRPPPPGR